MDQNLEEFYIPNALEQKDILFHMNKEIIVILLMMFPIGLYVSFWISCPLSIFLAIIYKKILRVVGKGSLLSFVYWNLPLYISGFYFFPKSYKRFFIL
ncbi:MAG: hypothetical protein ACI9IL_000771 [Rickettsiales bacterium]|jgi:hypothetical protein